MRTRLAIPFAVAATLLPGCAAREPDPPAGGSAAGAAGVDAVDAVVSRPEVMGLNGAVSSDHPLASLAGLEVLRRGGNAVDAAVTMAAVLAVVRPHMNGVGGDAFALIYDARTGRVAALNGSGRAGRLATVEFFRARGLSAVPETGALSVTVPGAVAAWADALARFGTLSLAQALAPAIEYAERGFPVTRKLRSDFAEWAERLDPAGRALYLAGGEPPAAGSLLRQPALAATLRRLARDGAGALYGGPLGDTLAAFLAAQGSPLRAEDFAAHRSEWTDPIATDYLGYRVLSLPPNSQGVTLLQQMRLAAVAVPDTLGPNTAEYLHRMVAIKQLAFADRDAWVADPAYVRVPVERMLDPDYARERARWIGERALATVGTGIGAPAHGGAPATTDGDGDTVYLTAVDRWGNAVSWIQSLYHGFGSGLLEPRTGVLLHNRGALFRLEPGHPQVIAPGKRPFHTLTAHMAFRGDRLAFTFGTPGGDGQTQTLLQVFHNLVRFGMPPQAAVEAPRYRSDEGRLLLLEDRIPAAARAELERRGYEVRTIAGWTATFGGAQLIWIDPASGVRVAAADPRREAYALAY